MRTCTPGSESAFSSKTVPMIRKLGTGLLLLLSEDLTEEDSLCPLELEKAGVAGRGCRGSCVEKRGGLERRTASKIEVRVIIRRQKPGK
jgi:hypothetical protein